MYGTSLDKSLLTLITFPVLDVVLTLMFLDIAVSCSPMFSVTRPRAKFSLFCLTFLAPSNIHFLPLFHRNASVLAHDILSPQNI